MDGPEKKDWLLDERLLQSQKLAAIGELSAGIAHEINNPLAIIRQEAEWMQHLLKKLGDGDRKELVELQGSVHQIVQQVDRCTEITRNLLDFARKRDPVIQAVEVNRIIENMTMLVEKEAKHKNITIVRRYDETLPVIYSDAPQLRQVILNFLTNATHAIGKDGVVTITTRLSNADAVDIAISDTGCGIPEENLQKVFDPFFTTKPPGQGTGLGLSICHGIILRLGGRIAVESTVGQGTEFTITLPRSRESELFAHA
ncbi:MAG TPA: ATP-binding protein [Desulfobaccales bacterium]|nr:ATP-binding protein [Desulfobaccales bacterium]